MEKMKMKMKSSLIIAIVAALMLPSLALASIGVSPASISFPDLLRSGYSQRTILISTLGEGIEATAVAGGDIAPWITLLNSTMNVPAGNPQALTVIINPPRDIPNGNYSGFITITRKPSGAADISGIGNVVIISVKVPISVGITDRQIIACSANSFSIESVEENSASNLKMVIFNEGNVRISPEVSADIWDQERQQVVKFLTLSSESILPSIETQVEFPVEIAGLPLGQYWVQVSVPECFASELLTFDVLEKGALSASGRLLQITNPPWIKVGETADVIGIFKNDGKKGVTARLTATVSLNRQIIKVLESEIVSVAIGETVNLSTFFRPESAGRYEITGKVYYEKKFTYEASSILNVNEKTGISAITIVYAVIIIASLLLMFAIFRKSRSRKRFRRF
jgi:hypothetical protein